MKRAFGTLFIATCLCVLTVAPVMAQTPSFPNAFFGAVTIDGAAAPAGTVIEARGTGVTTGISGNPLTTTAAGVYGGPGFNDLNLIVSGGIAEGAVIDFYINGIKVSQTAVWHSGLVTQLNLAAVSPPPVAPAAPVLSGVTVVSQTQININWTHDGVNLTGFRIQRSRDNFATVETTFAAATADRGFVNGGLTAATTYYFRILALNGTLPSAASNIVSAATQAVPVPIGGGGGGFGGSGSSELAGDGLVGTRPSIDGSGKTLNAGDLRTADNKCALSIPANTTVRNAAGAAVFSISAAPAAALPAAPPQGVVVQGFDMGPTGVTFVPAITMTLSYTDAQIPAGMAENSLYVAVWDGTKWVKLPSTVDPVNNKVTAPVDHFSSFGLLGQQPPPATTIPPVTTTAPPVTTTVPPVTTTSPPVATTAPPVTTSSPTTSSPPQTTTLSPTVPVTVAPVTTAKPPAQQFPVVPLVGGAAAGVLVLVLVLKTISRKKS